MEEQAIDGILGADILFPTQAVLDCRAQVLILKVDPNVRGSAPGLDFTGFQRMKIHVSSGYNLYVDGRLNGKRAKLMIDTGAFATLLHQPFVRRMKIPLREQPLPFRGRESETARRAVRHHLAFLRRLPAHARQESGRDRPRRSGADRPARFVAARRRLCSAPRFCNGTTPSSISGRRRFT